MALLARASLLLTVLSVSAFAQEEGGARGAGFGFLDRAVAPAEDSVGVSVFAMPGGRGAPDVYGESARGTHVVARSSDSAVSVSGRVGAVDLGALPIVLPTGVVVPRALRSVDGTAAYSRELAPRRRWGASAGVGSASDELFHGLRETELHAGAFYQIPSRRENSWLLMLNYSNNRTFLNNVPLPGFAYLLHDSEHRLDAAIGFPFLTVRWRPDDDWTLSGAVIGGANLSAEAARRVTGKLSAYLRVERAPQQWLRADRANLTDRLVFDSADARLGARAPLGHGLSFDVSGGRAFDRAFFEGRDATSRNASKTTLPNCWLVDARISWRL